VEVTRKSSTRTNEALISKLLGKGSLFLSVSALPIDTVWEWSSLNGTNVREEEFVCNKRGRKRRKQLLL
jgi:hypothetical protein